MSLHLPDLDLTDLLQLIRHGNTLLHKGDVAGTPLSDEARTLLAATVQVLQKRLLVVHLGPSAGPMVLGGLFDMAVALDTMVIQGDGRGQIEDAEVGILFAARQALVARGVIHPGGDVAAKMLNTAPAAQAAYARAKQVPRPVVRPAEAAPPPPPPPVTPPAEAASSTGTAVAVAGLTSFEGDRFSFGGGGGKPLTLAPVAVAAPAPAAPNLGLAPPGPQ